MNWNLVCSLEAESSNKHPRVELIFFKMVWITSFQVLDSAGEIMNTICWNILWFIPLFCLGECLKMVLSTGALWEHLLPMSYWSVNLLRAQPLMSDMGSLYTCQRVDRTSLLSLLWGNWKDSLISAGVYLDECVMSVRFLALITSAKEVVFHQSPCTCVLQCTDSWLICEINMVGNTVVFSVPEWTILKHGSSCLFSELKLFDCWFGLWVGVNASLLCHVDVHFQPYTDCLTWVRHTWIFVIVCGLKSFQYSVEDGFRTGAQTGFPFYSTNLQISCGICAAVMQLYSLFKSVFVFIRIEKEARNETLSVWNDVARLGRSSMPNFSSYMFPIITAIRVMFLWLPIIPFNPP